MTSADGGLFAYGDAGFYGTANTFKPSLPVVGIERTNSGNGYWQVALDGGIFSFGDAPFFGSASAESIFPVLGMERTASGNGYWLYAFDGGVFSYGDAQFHGSAASFGDKLQAPVIGFVASGPTAG